jgi:hypothetical protein
MFFYGDSKLEKTEPLDEAKAALETLLKQLNISGYVCDYALDMSVERIQTLVSKMQTKIASGQLTTNIPLPDLSKATAADEGYYLSHVKPCETYAQGNYGQFSVTAYVTERGVVNATIRDQYIRSEVYDTPETLLSPDEVLALLPGEVETSRVSSTVASVSTLRLIYTPRRASNKAGGMVLTTSWYIAYRTPDHEMDCFAIFDAVDRTLLDAVFN